MKIKNNFYKDFYKELGYIYKFKINRTKYNKKY